MSNTAGFPDFPLIEFGGFISEVNAYDVPSGSAAVATDCDFTVQSVRTRDGLENVYTFDGYDQIIDAGAGINVPVTPPGAVWANPENVTHDSPPDYASVTLNAVAETPAVYSVNNTFVQSGFTPSATKAVTIAGQDLQVGDVIMVIVTADNAFAGFTPAAPGINTPNDSNGNTYLAVGAPANLGPSGSTGFNVVAQPFYAINKTHIALGGTLNFTVSFNEASGWSDTTRVGVFASACVAGVTDTVLGTSSNSQASADPANPGAITVSVPAVFFSIVSAISTTGGPTSPWVDPSMGSSGGNNMNAFYLFAGAPGTYDGEFSNPSDTWANTWQIAFQTATSAAPAFSDRLEASSYGFTMASDSTVLGIQVTVKGQQSSEAAGDLMTLTVIGGTGADEPHSFQLPATQGNVVFGGIGEFFGQTWTPAQINNPGFGVLLQATSSAATSRLFEVSAAQIEVWFTPPGLENFTYVKTFAMTDGETLTLALDDAGTFWQEDVENDPGVLTPFFTAIEPNSFAQSTTMDDREFIAISDLMGGTDVPRQYNGQWVDRLSQVGPGAAPVVTFSATGIPIVSITQESPQVLGNSTNEYVVSWSNQFGSIGQTGNILSFQGKPGFFADVIAAGVGATIVISGVQMLNGQNPNNTMTNPTYTVVSAGTVTTKFWGPNSAYFSVQTTATNNVDVDVQAGATYQLTAATLTTSAPVPFLEVGSQATVSGSSVSSWDNSWTITQTPNAASMVITDTSLSGNVATYAYTLVTGTAPTIGEQVTVQGTNNGNGIFNVANATISAVGASSFSVVINSPDIPDAPEDGQGLTNGTIFIFDPGAIFMNGTGGSVEQTGGLGAGVRGCVVMFLTRNGLLTQASPEAIFSLTGDASSVTVSNILVGPPDTVARVVAFTGANGATRSGGGGFYFWIPEAVTVLDEGQNVTYSATIVNDNTSTQATFNFTDAVLLAGASISSQGSNNFAQFELGSSLGLVAFSQRIFAWGMQNKILNLLNYSFDGGIGQALGATITTFPPGWTVDPVSQLDVSLVNSPIFGNALYVKNSTGSTQAMYGTISQDAYQDQNNTPIVMAAKEYSVRVTAMIPSGNTGGNLVVDLYQPSLNKIWGSFTIPFSALSQDVMTIETGSLLSTAFAVVPNDLVIRLYGTDMAAGADYEVDRIEPFITDEPVATTDLYGSYFDNFEAFDSVTGRLGVASQNQQPVRSAFELFDNLYVVKTKSMVSTTDNGITEPSGWTVREVSNKVGTPSVFGVDVGEGWALVEGQAGVYIFEGGQPVKISPELDGNPGLWGSIDWTYGYTTWIRNDTNNRRFFVGVPIPTPNQWMPGFPANPNPTKPNVVLMCNYKELMTSAALQSSGPVRLSYTGELKSYAIGRKWSAWSIEAAFADFVVRPDTTDHLFYCGDENTGKIYQQIAGNYADDGDAMFCEYITYPFPKTTDAQQKGINSHQLEAHFMSLLIQGGGQLRPTIYPNQLDSPYADALYPEELQNPMPAGDMEIPLNEKGNRFFVGLRVRDVGEWFELSRIVMNITADPWAPERGSN